MINWSQITRRPQRRHISLVPYILQTSSFTLSKNEPVSGRHQRRYQIQRLLWSGFSTDPDPIVRQRLETHAIDNEAENHEKQIKRRGCNPFDREVTSREAIDR